MEGNNNYFADGVLVHNCEHLEAVTSGEITRLLINCPPGCMKSLTTEVFWPAWEWGPCGRPALRYITASYSQGLTIRDNQRFLRLISSPEYRAAWGDRFSLEREGEIKVMNDKTGWKLATSVGGIGTGERGDRFIIDDPHNIKDGESDAIRESTLQWFQEVVPTRLNDPMTSAIIIIMQRVHDADVSGRIMAGDLGYDYLCMPMEYDPSRFRVSVTGWQDPRHDDEAEDLGAGKLIWPERMPDWVVARDKIPLGPYGVAAQFQQEPVPKGGGVFRREWWRIWDIDLALEYGRCDQADVELKGDGALRFPAMEYKIASLDSAYGLKQENDFSALTVWGAWRDKLGNPRLMLMYAWRGRLPLHAPGLKTDDLEQAFEAENRGKVSPIELGLVEKVAFFCKRYDVDRLLIEGKANGTDVAREIQRLNRDQTWGVTVVDHGRTDKGQRAIRVQHLFSEGLVFLPGSSAGVPRSWGEAVIDEMQKFPKAAHDDFVDSCTQALYHLRQTGFAPLAEERAAVEDAKARRRPKPAQPIYPV